MKDIPGYEGEYGATEDGQIYSYKSNKRLATRIHKGYEYINLNGTTWQVHQLIAKTYIPNPENKPTVDHIDRNKLNNVVSNLRWATQSEQNENKDITDAMMEAYKSNPSKAVEQRKLSDHSLIATYPSSCAAAEALFGDKSKNSLINRCANGKRPSAYGYWWCFK